MVTFDGFYLMVAITVVFGFVWLFVARRPVQNLEKVPKSEWLVVVEN